MEDVGPKDGDDVTDRERLVWRGFTLRDEGPYPDHPASSAFLSASDDHISVCVVDPEWPRQYTPDWLKPHFGLAELTVGAYLDAGFARVVWAQHQAEGFLEGHAHAYYTPTSGNARRRQARRASERSSYRRRASQPPA